jgi:hypothetical protein
MALAEESVNQIGADEAGSPCDNAPS